MGILKLLIIIAFIALTPVIGSASSNSLNLFDKQLVSSEEEACHKFDKSDSKDYKNWLVGEIKRISEIEPMTGSTNTQIWERDAGSLKIDGEPKDANLDPKSPGTFGKINDTKLSFSNVDDGKTLRAPLIDVDEGVATELKDRSDLAGRIWLVKQSEQIPSVVVLSMEAKLNKALGLIIYGPDKADLDPPGALTVLPMVRISEITAKEIKKKIKEKETIAELSSKTEFPKNKPQDWAIVKMGARSVHLALTANYTDCKAVSTLLGILDWLKKSSLEVQGTTFGFMSGDKSPLGEIASETQIDGGSFDSDKFLKEWMRSDRDISDLIDGRKILKRALGDAGNFAGLVDKELLNQYKSELKKLESVVKDRPEVAFQLKNIYQSDGLSDLALDLKNLRQIHNFAQRGQWEKAISQFQKIPDYEWASNVSCPIFIEYTKSLAQPDLRVNPALWGQLQLGRDHLDGFIEAVEVEIDRIDKKLSDNFFKVHKSIENLDKI